MIIVVLFVLGLCFGSFVNALVWRLHEQNRSAKRKKVNKDLSIVQGRSMCPDCGHILSAIDLVPIVSWLTLKGRCRYCHKTIPWQYPLVELTTAVLFVASYIWWPERLVGVGLASFVVWLVMLVGFMALLVYDVRWMILPNRIIYPLIVLAIVLLLARITIFGGGFHDLLGRLLAVVVSGGIFYALFQLSNGKWIGGGDVKLGFLLGLLLSGPLEGFMVLFLASLLGVASVVPGMVRRTVTATSKIPFGPFLIIAGIIIKLFGIKLIAWYESIVFANF